MRRMFLSGTAMAGKKGHHAITGARFVGAARTAARCGGRRAYRAALASAELR
jgi:hypothetical protein